MARDVAPCRKGRALGRLMLFGNEWFTPQSSSVCPTMFQITYRSRSIRVLAIE